MPGENDIVQNLFALIYNVQDSIKKILDMERAREIWHTMKGRGQQEVENLNDTDVNFS